MNIVSIIVWLLKSNAARKVALVIAGALAALFAAYVASTTGVPVSDHKGAVSPPADATAAALPDAVTP